MNFLAKLLTAVKRLTGGKRTRQPRICARCTKPIKRGHKWSAKAWIDDPRPRHWDCDNPNGAQKELVAE